MTSRNETNLNPEPLDANFIPEWNAGVPGQQDVNLHGVTDEGNIYVSVYIHL